MALARLGALSGGSPGAWLPQRGPATAAAAVIPRRLSIRVMGPDGAEGGHLPARSRWAELHVEPPDLTQERTDAVLMLSDQTPDLDTLDDLLAVALRFPEAGAYLLSPRPLDPRCPFVARTATPQAFARGVLLVTAARWPEMLDLDRRDMLAYLKARGGRPVMVQTPRRPVR
jgi:hypothetical protein